MQVMGFIVWVRVPDGLTPQNVAEEVKTSVGFGQAQVAPIFLFPDSTGPVLNTNILTQHTDFLAHDGYARHSHVNQKSSLGFQVHDPHHIGVHRKEWDQDV